MNINYKQPQFELFPAHSATLDDTDKPRFLLANLTLSVESLVIFSILGIMVALFAFSLGVERGKNLAAQTLDERVSAAWNAPAARVVRPVVAVPALVGVAKPSGTSSLLPAGNRRVPPYHLVAASGTGIRYTVQVATYAKEENARRDAVLFQAKGFKSFLIKSGKYWLLCVDSFTSKENATAFLKKLPSPYRGSQVRRF